MKVLIASGAGGGTAKTIMKNSFFIGIHTGIKKQQQEFVKDTFNEFISERVRR